ncbi:hypothetical protein C1701_05005 [Actinoalloteichus sp. AHMU CJ021]|uniref:Uncharacterized protein n=1 Tax=Actinoalloteichus caeruleus DSM 43889 TaxID=1120930 RepID=A0ABT1JH35_ACTCY|nr:hypothetical protein [Actinoalloteichus caeruleus]AUS77825.1 hypothetical protein C1701_05005 [Actinoalloteichus sp. AHMU CJ021]MCP2331782.1 hypothetical protein [Actinoalloteichus caeruleus DSM 43889]
MAASHDQPDLSDTDRDRAVLPARPSAPLALPPETTNTSSEEPVTDADQPRNRAERRRSAKNPTERAQRGGQAMTRQPRRFEAANPRQHAFRRRG